MRGGGLSDNIEKVLLQDFQNLYVFIIQFCFIAHKCYIVLLLLVWNLLAFSSIVSLLCAIAIFIGSCILLDALRYFFCFSYLVLILLEILSENA